MKTTRIAFFRILVFIAMIAFNGSDLFANATLNPFTVEFSECGDINTIVVPDTDSFGEDLISRTNGDFSCPELLNPNPVLHDSRPVPQSASSIWQPPQC